MLTTHAWWQLHSVRPLDLDRGILGFSVVLPSCQGALGRSHGESVAPFAMGIKGTQAGQNIEIFQSGRCGNISLAQPREGTGLGTRSQSSKASECSSHFLLGEDGTSFSLLCPVSGPESFLVDGA